MGVKVRWRCEASQVWQQEEGLYSAHPRPATTASSSANKAIRHLAALPLLLLLLVSSLPSSHLLTQHSRIDPASVLPRLLVLLLLLLSLLLLHQHAHDVGRGCQASRRAAAPVSAAIPRRSSSAAHQLLRRSIPSRTSLLLELLLRKELLQMRRELNRVGATTRRTAAAAACAHHHCPVHVANAIHSAVAPTPCLRLLLLLRSGLLLEHL